MRPAHYLETLTGINCPGRFAIKTVRMAGGQASDKKMLADQQADMIIEYCVKIHEHGQKDIGRAFELALEALKDRKDLSDTKELRERIFSEIKNACYPYIYISANDIRATLDYQKKEGIESPLLLAPRDHMTTLAEPALLRGYYLEQCRVLLANGYPLEAGLSIVPMPVTYAIEHSDIGNIVGGRVIFEAIQSFFPVPRLSEIDDSVIDGRYLRDDQSIVVNQEYTLLNSIFWECYEQYLRSGDWKHQLAFPDDASSAFFRKRLLETRTKLTEIKPPQTEKVVAFDGVRGSIVAGREEPISATSKKSNASTARKEDAQQSARLPSRVKPKPLSYFDALRTHFSLSRLRYYTGTDAEFFQKHILLVNYREYVKQFILRALVEIYRLGADHDSKLVVAWTPKDTAKRGRVLDYKVVAELFKPGDGLPKLKLVEDLIRSRGVVEELPEGDPTRIAYRECWEKVAREVLGSSEVQMPAYHYIAPQVHDTPRESTKVPDETALRKRVFEATDLPSITMVDMGVGASNAKAITDHLAVLRPRCWILVGRCSGLRRQQHIGDYVFATSYVRRDGVLDRSVPLDAPIKTTRVIVDAFEKASAHLVRLDRQSVREARKQGPLSRVTRLFSAKGGLTPEEEEAHFHALRRFIRLGTVISTNDRNWETAPTEELLDEFGAYRAIAVDMEGGAVAANGYRYRVHHGSFLCVSAKPLHGSVRIRQLQDNFYVRQSGRHLEIAIGAIRWLEYNFESALLLQYSRELRGSDDPPWD